MNTHFFSDSLSPYLAEMAEERFRNTVFQDAKNFLKEELNVQTLVSLGLGMGMHSLAQTSYRFVQNKTGVSLLAHASRIAIPLLGSAVLEGSGLNAQTARNALGFEFSNLASQGLEIFLTGRKSSRFFKMFVTRTLNPLFYPLAEKLLGAALHCVGVQSFSAAEQHLQASDYFRYLGRDLLFSGLHHSALRLKRHLIPSTSITAQLVSYARGVASEQKLYACSDPWAKRFCEADALIIGEAIIRQRPKYREYMAVRTAWLDRLIAQFSQRHSTSQIVILGAGFDTRSARLKGGGRHFFEVDHPSTSRMKRRQVQQLKDYPGDPTYVECDFSRDCFLEKLRSKGFNDHKPTLFIMEGVSMYLNDEALRTNIRKVKSLTQAAYVFDYINSRALRLIQGTLFDSIALKNNERMVWGSDDPSPLFRSEGVLARRITFEEAARELNPHQPSEKWLGLYGFMLGSE